MPIPTVMNPKRSLQSACKIGQQVGTDELVHNIASGIVFVRGIGHTYLQNGTERKDAGAEEIEFSSQI